MTRNRSEFRPIPWPRSGPVERLILNIAGSQASVFVHQTAWPRQPQNPNWRIEVTDLDGRLGETTLAHIRHACEETARIYLSCWLAADAPFLTLATATWPQLVALATEYRYRTLSPYQKRRAPTRRAAAPGAYARPYRARPQQNGDRAYALDLD